MNVKQVRKIQLTNMALWIAAIFLPIVARAFASKDPKIFEFLMPMWQIMLAIASTRMFGTLQTPTNKLPNNDVETQ